jgi:hypothetical protein
MLANDGDGLGGGNVEAWRPVGCMGIQSGLAHLMNEGIVIHTKWQGVMGQSEEAQRADSSEVPYWHAKIEHYIRTLPRSDVLWHN